MTTEPDTTLQPKVLLVGALVPLKRRGDPGYTRASGLASAPALHDFGVIVLRYSNSSFQVVPRVKWDEWNAFLRAGGYAVVMGIDVTLQRHLPRLAKVELPLERLAGEGVSWIRGTLLHSALNGRLCQRWTAVVPRAHEHETVVLGRNNAGSAIAFEIAVGPGRVAFLPNFDETQRLALVAALVNNARGAVRQVHLGRTLPDWLVALPLESEKLLRLEGERISNRLNQLQRAKRILIDDGKALSKECSRILQEILGPAGYSVTWKEEEGSHDIEISGSSTTFLVEVRGATRAVDVDLARQLMDHLITFRPETSRVKGILLGNPYRADSMPRTGPPLTKNCKELAVANSFCFLTTHQLLEVYDQFVSGRLDVASFITALGDTVGEFRFRAGLAS